MSLLSLTWVVIDYCYPLSEELSMIQDDDDDDIIIYKQVLWGNIWKVLTLRDQNFLLLPFTDWIMPRLVENCERTCPAAAYKNIYIRKYFTLFLSRSDHFKECQFLGFTQFNIHFINIKQIFISFYGRHWLSWDNSAL